MNYNKKYVKYKRKYSKLKEQITGIPKKSDSDIITNNMIDANNEFTIDLFDNLDGASNIFSPLAISFALSLIHLGSIGQASEQLTRVLGYKYDADELKTLRKSFNNQVFIMENALLYDKNIRIKMPYMQMVDRIVMIKPFDLINLHKINNRIEHKTDGMIKDIISFENEIEKNSMIISSIAYFKASWQHKFDAANTKKVIFHKTERNIVELMHQINNFKYYENDSVQLVELPYDERDYVMGIILPKRFLDATNLDYSINNVPQFSRQEINELINNTEYKLVDLSIPKFVQNKRFNLIPILKKMGLSNIFSPLDSNFDIGKVRVHISHFVHESLIMVDEMGANTITNNHVIQFDERPTIFRADHAFIYYVRHVPSGLFLFYGDYQGNKETII